MFILVLIAIATIFWTRGSDFVLAIIKSFVITIILAIIALFIVAPVLVKLGLLVVIV